MDVCRVEFFYNLISIYTNLFITCIFAYKNTFCNVDLFAHHVKLFIRFVDLSGHVNLSVCNIHFYYLICTIKCS